MVLTNVAKDRRTCRQKTGRGNVYASQGKASFAARAMAAKAKGRGRVFAAAPYQCPVCSRWHIGTADRWDYAGDG